MKTNQLTLYKAKVAVCSDIRTKHSTKSEHHVEFLNVKPWWYVKKTLGFKMLITALDGVSRQLNAPAVLLPTKEPPVHIV